MKNYTENTQSDAMQSFTIMQYIRPKQQQIILSQL